MAKIRRYKLTWNASESKDIAGYRVYWSEGNDVDYDSKYIDLFNLTQLVIFDEVMVPGKTVMFGVSAVDFDGNESDITKLPEPFQVKVPKAPTSLSIISMEKFRILESQKTTEPVNVEINDDPLAKAIESHESQDKKKMKFYDDIGYRKPLPE